MGKGEGKIEGRESWGKGKGKAKEGKRKEEKMTIGERGRRRGSLGKGGGKDEGRVKEKER